jgi:hypothetical protein
VLRYTIFSIGLIGIVAAICAGEQKEKIKIVSDHDGYTKIMPSSDDGFLDKIKVNPDLVWYDRETVPPIHQHWRKADIGIAFEFGLVPDKINISAEKTEPFGNPNREFPWLVTAGTDEKTSVINFVVLSKEVTMEWKQVTAGNYDKNWPILTWTYPIGTIFGEVIFVVDPNNNKIPCEVRIRRKSETGWLATAYRPFPTSDDLRDACLDIDKADREIIINALDKPTTKLLTFKNNHPDLTIIDEKATLEYLPEIKPSSVKILLNRKFKNALGSEWRKTNPPTHAPTTESNFHIVPKNYEAAAIEVSTKSCSRCHDSVAKEAADFDVKRDWYGHVRGSDAIFTFHPFDPKINEKRSHNDKDTMFRKDKLGKMFTFK